MRAWLARMSESVRQLATVAVTLAARSRSPS
jgi:hypothetical protein